MNAQRTWFKRGSRDIGIAFSDWSCDYFGNRFWILKRKRLQGRQNQCRIKFLRLEQMPFRILRTLYKLQKEIWAHYCFFSNCDTWMKGKLPMIQVWIIRTDHLQFTTHLRELWIPKRHQDMFVQSQNIPYFYSIQD